MEEERQSVTDFDSPELTASCEELALVQKEVIATEIKAAIIENIVESLPLGLLLINPQGEIHIANSSACRILGYSQEELIGKGWAELFFELEENDQFNQVFIDVIQEQTLNLHRSVPYRQRAQATLHLSITTSFLKVKDELQAIVVLIEDETHLYRMRERERIILEEKNRIQRQKAESLNKLALAVAHQLRNPLTTIGGFAQLMMKRSSEQTSSCQYLDNILSDVRRLDRIVKAVESYSNLPPLNLQNVLAARIIDELLRNGQLFARSVFREIEWAVVREVEMIYVDPGLFVQAMNEIILNAVQFMGRPQGAIKIGVYKKELGFRVEVADNGMGIKESDLAFIFDPFFTSRADAVGMGLCRAQRIIAEHNGNLTVQSSVDVGTTVTINLISTPA